MRKDLSLAVSVLLVFIGGTPTRAQQLVVPPFRSAAVIDDIFSLPGAPPLCGLPFRVDGPGSVAANCSHDGGTFSASASNVGGLIRASASSTMPFPAPSPTASQTDARSFTRWADRISFLPGVQPAFVQLTLHFSGSVFANMPTIFGPPSEDYGEAIGGWGFDTYDPLGSQILLGSHTIEAFSGPQYLAENPNVGNNAPTSASLDDNPTFVVPVDYSSLPFFLPSANFGYSFFATTTVVHSFVPSSYFYDGSTVADFSDTGFVTDIEFLDANHDRIQGGVNYEFLNGTSVFAVATPEPTTLSLVALGLAVVGLRWSRRR